MKKWILMAMVVTTISLLGCSPASTPSGSVSTPKKITLEEATNILDLSLFLPSRFEKIDAANEGMSNKDMGLGEDFSEVQVFISENPYQMVYWFLGITKSRLEQATFDKMLGDETQMRALIIENIKKGAEEQGGTITVPEVEITHPAIGDSALLGEGKMETSGFNFGFDTLWFRSNTVYVFTYSLFLSEDKVSLIPISKEIEERLGKYSQ